MQPTLSISRVRFKRVLRYSPRERKLGLFRLLWVRGDIKTDKNAYSAKLSFAVRPVWFRWQKEWRSYRMVLLGIDVHYKRSYGGIMV